MTKPVILRVTVLLILAVSGCGKSDFTAKTEGTDPALYAQSIKTSVLQFVQDAKRSPKSAGERAAVLLEKLEVYSTQPVGEYGSIYEQLNQTCKDLVETAKKSGNVTQKLNEMAALANKLPGEVKLVTEPDPRQS